MKRLSRSQLFLLELMIDLIFFCACSAVCIALLAHAHALSTDSAALSHAVVAAENAAEAFRASEGDTAQTARLLEADAADGTVKQYFDAAWQPSVDGGAYVLKMQMQGDILRVATVTVFRTNGGEALYTLIVQQYAGEMDA